MSEMLVALDIATKVGWAIGQPGATPIYGTRDFGDRKKTTTGEVLSRFANWLELILQQRKPDLVVFEAPFLPHAPNLGTIRRLTGMVGQVEALCWDYSLRCREATVGQISKFFIGTARLQREEKKAATIEMCRRLGFDPPDDNAADALALWCMAEATIDPAAGQARGIGLLFAPPKMSAPRRREPAGRDVSTGKNGGRRAHRRSANNTSGGELQLPADRIP